MGFTVGDVIRQVSASIDDNSNTNILLDNSRLSGIDKCEVNDGQYGFNSSLSAGLSSDAYNQFCSPGDFIQNLQSYLSDNNYEYGTKITSIGSQIDLYRHILNYINDHMRIVLAFDNRNLLNNSDNLSVWEYEFKQKLCFISSDTNNNITASNSDNNIRPNVASLIDNTSLLELITKAMISKTYSKTRQIKY